MSERGVPFVLMVAGTLTDTDWPRVGEAHRRWLDPAEFDARMMQHQRMSEVFATLKA